MPRQQNPSPRGAGTGVGVAEAAPEDPNPAHTPPLRRFASRMIKSHLHAMIHPRSIPPAQSRAAATQKCWKLPAPTRRPWPNPDRMGALQGAARPAQI